ncbi:hypothetical protein AX16_004301 [Volvariella volvacea WC 439]|nr:hypothetical protein AX16_004301 [Volvariella volvacea WC 439]
MPSTFELNSLYVCTVPLISGAFHWSFIHVDQNRVLTRHHWAGATPEEPWGPEDYVEQALSKTPLTTANTQILGCFKIKDLIPPDVITFRKLCRKLSPKTYPTADMNRQHGISCKAWMTNIVGELTTRERADQVERNVAKRSKELEVVYLGCFIKARTYDFVVEAV